MFGSLYGYTPWSAPRETPGQAFAAGLRDSREDERRLMAMDEARQQARLRELQEGRAAAAEGRTAQRFPIDLETAQQTLRAAQQTYGFNERADPYRLDELRLRNQRTQQGIADADTTRRAVAEYARGAGTTAPTAPQGVTIPQGETPYIIRNTPAPAAPAPAAPAAPAPTPGPQSSLEERPSWLSPEFGQRRFTGVGPMLASGGVSDYTGGFPTGYTGQEFVSVSAQAPQAAPTAPGVQPTQGAVIARPLTAMTPREVMAYLNPIPGFNPPPGFTPSDARLELARRGIEAGYVTPFQGEAEAAAFGGSMPMPAAAYNPNLLPVEDAAQATGGPPAPTLTTQGVTPTPMQVTVPGVAPTVPATPPAATTPGAYPALAPAAPGAMTDAEMAAATAGRGGREEMGTGRRVAGVTPQGERTPEQTTADLTRRIENLTRDPPPMPLSVLSPVQIGNEERALAAQERALENRRRLAATLARSNPTAALQIANEVESQAQAIALNRANLNGRRAVSEFAAGNPEPLARDIYIASGGVLRLEPLPDGRFNIWGRPGEAAPRARNVTRQELINEGRMLYDNNYRSQMDAIRDRRLARTNAIFDAHINGLKASLEEQAAASRQIAIDRAKAMSERDFRGTEIFTEVNQANGVILFYDRRNPNTPIRAMRPVPRVDPTTGRRAVPEAWDMQEVQVPAAASR